MLMSLMMEFRLRLYIRQEELVFASIKYRKFLGNAGTLYWLALDSRIRLPGVLTIVSTK